MVLVGMVDVAHIIINLDTLLNLAVRVEEVQTAVVGLDR